MDDFNKEQIRQWTLSKIESNPKLFGGDEGNPSIIKAYLFDIHSIDISLDTARCISTVNGGVKFSSFFVKKLRKVTLSTSN